MMCLKRLFKNAMHAASCETSLVDPGLRADVFGDLIFIDHGEIKYNPSNAESSEELSSTFFIILDGATNLISAYQVASANENEAREALREFMHHFQVNPNE